VPSQLTRSSITIPVYPVHRQRLVTVPLREATSVGVGNISNVLPLCVGDGTRIQPIALDWFPPEWDSHYAIRD
jgi:hypothetical protein